MHANQRDVEQNYRMDHDVIVECGQMDAICICIDLYYTDTNQKRYIARIEEVGGYVTKFKKGDLVLIPDLIPAFNTNKFETHSYICEEKVSIGWKFIREKSNEFKKYFHINCADVNLKHLDKKINIINSINNNINLDYLNLYKISSNSSSNNPNDLLN